MSRLRGASPELLLAALASGSCSRVELQARLGISQPTISRLVRAASSRLAVLGRGPATRYAAVRAIPRLGERIPMYRIDGQGQVHVQGELVPLMGGEFWCEFVGRPGMLHPGLPHFLADMQLQGFMGRAFTSRVTAELGFPARLVDWNDDAHLLAMALYGEDLYGNLIVGEESLRRFYTSHEREVLATATDRAQEYPRKAGINLDSNLGSSAGGEQPKFTYAWRDDEKTHHVIVKFSPAGDAPFALRWRDLLRAEKLALDVLRENGTDAAEALLLEAGGRLFLEVERFDRMGERGRLGLLSLGAIDDHRFGARDNWSRCASRMLHERMISPEEARQLVLLDTFGAMIANTDRHFGNISLFIENFSYSLAPAYDMLPMRYRPNEEGEVVQHDFSPPYPDSVNREVWLPALRMALSYWERLAGMTLVSPGFREIAAQNAKVLEGLQSLPLPL